MSTNWGALTIGAVVGGNIGNMWYGVVLDSMKGEDGICLLGKECYRNAYLLAVAMSIGGMIVAGIGVRRGWETGRTKRGKMPLKG